MHLRLWHFTILAAAILTVGAGCARHRPIESEAQLLERRDHLAARNNEVISELSLKLLDRIRSEYELKKQQGSNEPPTCDILVISGGGDFGAFGAGFLKGWGSVREGGLPRPQFEIVSGVSTGALIAPFAYLGENKDIDDVVHLYTNPRPDWVRERGILFFLPANESFAEVPGLERELENAIDGARIARIAEQGRLGRMLVVNTTDLDDGSPRAFEISRVAIRAEETGDPTRLHKLLLASSGIPGAFPPREIDGGLYVDGGVTGNILYGGRLRRDQSVGALWARNAPDLPKVRIRYWVILNNWLMTPPKTTQPNWVDVIARSVDLAVRSSTVTGLRHLLTIAELENLRGDFGVEVRIVAIPSAWRPPVEGVFKEETMRDLARVGEELGRDPNAWIRELAE
ncbi:MAG: hypothetical protein RLY21_2483 [Planctomycetota bacterium]|jgi:hypothetical protein